MESEGRESAEPAGRGPRRSAAIPVDQWFAGHRHAERRHVRFPVEMSGASLTLHGTALDLSASGILVGVPMSSLLGKSHRTDLLGVYVTLHHTWDDGIGVSVPGHGAIGRARVARIVAGSDESRPEVLLGLRFEQPLPSAFMDRWSHRQNAPTR